jgi:hypothetical protein
MPAVAVSAPARRDATRDQRERLPALSLMV